MKAKLFETTRADENEQEYRMASITNLSIITHHLLY